MVSGLDRTSLHQLVGLLRFHDWQSKTAFFIVAIGLAMTNGSPNLQNQLADAAILFLLLSLFAALGYSINQYFDREVDAVVKQSSINAQFPLNLARNLIAALFICTLTLSLAWSLSHTTKFFIFYWLGICSAVAYSSPPFRFKERGYLGWVVSSLAQRVLPFVAIFEAFDYWNIQSLSLCLLAAMLGLRYIIVHQLDDYQADIDSGVVTVATSRGKAFPAFVLKWFVFPLELLLLVVTLALMSQQIWTIYIGVLLYCLTLLVALQLKREGLNAPQLSLFSYDLLWGFYCVYWPLSVALYLTLMDVAYVPFLIFTLIWTFNWFKQDLVTLSHSATKIARALQS